MRPPLCHSLQRLWGVPGGNKKRSAPQNAPFLYVTYLLYRLYHGNFRNGVHLLVKFGLGFGEGFQRQLNVFV